jgi:hypothetical protein
MEQHVLIAIYCRGRHSKGIAICKSIYAKKFVSIIKNAFSEHWGKVKGTNIFLIAPFLLLQNYSVYLLRAALS